MSPVSPLASIAILGGALLALVVVLWGCFKKQQMAWLAAAYLVCFAPTSNLLLVVGVGMAERLAYLPSIWFCALMALVLSRLIRSPLAYWGVVVVLLGGLLTTTLWRNRDFASEISLWQADVERDPQNVLAWLALSNSYQTAGRVEEGENYLRNKLVQVPDLAQAQSVYADILLSQERYAEALDYALRAEADPATDMVINKFILARAYLGIGRYAESLLWLEKSRSMYGPYGTFWAIQGMALEGLGRDQEAIASYRQVVDMPLGSDVPGRLAGLLMKQRDYAGAEASYREALRRQPSAANWNALAVALALQGKTTAAVAAFKQAVALNPGEPSYRENLLRAQDEDADGSRAQKP
jgi:tetratricopeptide (TPR) repeat protein